VEQKSPALCKARLHGSDKALYRNVAIDYHGSGMLVQPLDIEEVRHFSRVEQSLMQRGGLLLVANVAASACVEQEKRLSGLFPFTLRFSTPCPITSLPSESPFLLDCLGSSLSVLASQSYLVYRDGFCFLALCGTVVVGSVKAQSFHRARKGLLA
jgi:hypothetical protein